MNSQKWKRVSVGEVVDELRITTDDPIKEGIEYYIGFEHIEPENLQVKQFGNINDGINFNKTFRRDDVLFGKIRAYLKKVAVAPFDGLCSSDILVLRTKDESILSQELLPYAITTNSFYKLAIDSSIGTTMPRTKWQYISKHVFPLPPLDEQKRIVELFQNIEQSIFQADKQEKNLRKLYKSLIDGLVNDKPSFGDLLKSKKLKRVRYCDVAQKLTRRIDPVDFGIERIVAGENLEAEDFKIRTWGTVGKDFLGPAFHVLFQAGDILYGSRRTYLKKVALADFDGVCANTTYVIRANEEFLLQDLLKHIMLSERFTQYSISVSKGSTNPYINWKDLDNFIFEIPDLETQRIISNLLDEILANSEKLRQQREILKKLKQKLLNEILS